MSKITIELDPTDGAALVLAARMLAAATQTPTEIVEAPKPPPAVEPAAEPEALAPTPELLSPAPSVEEAPATTIGVAPPPPSDTTAVAPEVLASVSPATPAEAPAVELDSSGMPWDARINNAGKTKMANGTWKLRVTPKEYATKEDWQAYAETIRDELRGAMGAAPAPVEPSAPATGHTFATVLAAITSNGIDSEVVNTACHTISGGAIPNMAAMGARPDLVPMLAAQLGV